MVNSGHPALVPAAPPPTALHARIRRFVEFVRPRRPKRSAAVARVVECLSERAADEAIDVIEFAYTGSIEKGTGLRAYDDGDVVVPGQDVDIALVIGDVEVARVARVYARLAELFGACLAERGQLGDRDFRKSRLQLELAPVLDVRGLGQFWIAEDRSLTPISLREQIERVRSRTRRSVQSNPRVPFNDAVRLLKWWHLARPPKRGRGLGGVEIERLAAYTYDRVGVDESWEQTLAKWCAALAEAGPAQAVDPALRAWFDGGREALERAGERAEAGELHQADAALAERMFGAAFTNVQS